MILRQTFYFRPIKSPIMLSKAFSISLRNPSEKELSFAEKNINILFGSLSDKEKRRIIYCLHPFGVPSPQGSLHEIFVKELAKIWVLVEHPQQLPLSMEEYGVLCGFYTEGGHIMNPSSFIADTNSTNQRFWLRALKKELAVASSLIANPCDNLRLSPLIDFCRKLDGILVQKEHLAWLKQLASIFISPENLQEKAFLKYIMALEVMILPKSSDIRRKFAEKNALLYYLCLKNKNQKALESPEKIEKFFAKAYKKRSEMVHGSISSVKIPIEPLFYNIRLGLELMVDDPILFFYLKNL
ncbi:MAG: hypothetical protein ACRC9L_07955 [Brevinema sp.]